MLFETRRFFLVTVHGSLFSDSGLFYFDIFGKYCNLGTVKVPILLKPTKLNLTKFG